LERRQISRPGRGVRCDASRGHFAPESSGFCGRIRRFCARIRRSIHPSWRKVRSHKGLRAEHGWRTRLRKCRIAGASTLSRQRPENSENSENSRSSTARTRPEAAAVVGAPGSIDGPPGTFDPSPLWPSAAGERPGPARTILERTAATEPPETVGPGTDAACKPRRRAASGVRAPILRRTLGRFGRRSRSGAATSGDRRPAPIDRDRGSCIFS
jgi:hypothetical protein